MPIFSEISYKSHLLVRLLRSYNTRGMILFYLLGRILAGNFKTDTDLFLVPIIFICTYGIVSLFNYDADRREDKINKRRNPLENKLSKKFINKLITILVIFVATLLTFVNHKLGISIASVSIIITGFLYSHKKIQLSHRPLTKIVLMMSGYTFIPGILGLSNNRIDKLNLFLIFSLSLIYASFLIYSDVKDITGDKKVGKITLAVLLGYKKLCVLGFVLALLGTIPALYLLRLNENFQIIASFFSIPILLQTFIIINCEAILKRKVRVVGSYIVLLFFVGLVLSLSLAL